MNKTTTILTSIATAAILSISLAACTQAATTTEPTSKPAVTETAAPVEKPAAPVALEGDQDGNGRLSEWEKGVLAKNSARDYTLADGTTVKVDPTQPLPAPVAEAVKAHAAVPTAGSKTTDRDAQDRSYAALRASLDADAAATGRGILVVYQAASAGEGLIWVPAISGDKYSPFLGSADKASVVAEATTWAANKGYELIVL
jgi:hypothetical protein